MSKCADFLRRFRPCVVNYGVQFRHSTSGSYFITPNGGYSKQWGIPQFGIAPEEAHWGGIWFIGTEAECEQKLDRDLALLVCSGFNAVRIFGVAPAMNSNGLTYPIIPQSEASLSEYLGLLTKLLTKIASHGLKAILLFGANAYQDSGLSDLYRKFLIDVCTSVGEHPGLLAYDLYNEPAWSYPYDASMNKLVTSHWIADSYWTIKSVSPNQLVTIGLTHPDTIAIWDPALIPVDFVSYHFYARPPAVAVTDAIGKVASMCYWVKQTSIRPWIIGETAVAGTDDPAVTGPIVNQTDQKMFADATLQASLNCGGDGYSWWQYQDVPWGDESDYMGLITRLDPSDPSNSESKKLAFFSFASYAGLEPKNAVKPAIYDNLDKHSVVILSGQISDVLGQPLGDASLVAWCGQSWTAGAFFVYSTLSAPDGSFLLKAPSALSILKAEVSKPGFGVAELGPMPSGSVVNFALEALRDDAWSRRWAASAPGQLDVLPGSNQPDWVINPTDTFYVGDFDGDGADEFLCAQNLGSAGDLMTMLRFNGNWTVEWTNGVNPTSSVGDPAKGSGIYPYRQRMAVGDFDGDGADELLGLGAGGDWITLFKYWNADWQWVSSTAGNQQHPLKPYVNKIHVGNFNGSGGELLLGVAGLTTLFRFDPGRNDWQLVDSDSGTTNDPTHPLSYVRPYASQLMIGDFDGDGRDEVLGIATSSAGSWVTMFGVRASGSLEWLISNNGSAAAVLSSIVPYQNRAIVGRFDGPARDRVLGLAGYSAMFGVTGEEFQRIWDSVRMKLAGFDVTPADKVLAFRPLRAMPDYLLVIPDSTRKASLIAFDPVLRSPET